MVKTLANHALRWTTLALLAVALAVAEQPTSVAATPAKKTSAKRYHRLPAYYAPVVNNEQRQKIYDIQDEYRPKIDALQTQLDALKKECNEKIAAVLTEDQKNRVEEAAASAKRRRKAVKPVEIVPEASPAEPAPTE